MTTSAEKLVERAGITAGATAGPPDSAAPSSASARRLAERLAEQADHNPAGDEAPVDTCAGVDDRGESSAGTR